MTKFRNHAFLLLMGLCFCGASVSLRGARMPLGAFANGRFPGVAPSASGFGLVDAFPNIRVPDPIDLVELPDNEGWLIVSKRGKVYWSPSPSSAELRVVLDRSDVTVSSSDDGGMYAIVLHPDFGASGALHRRSFFVTYQYSEDRPGVIAPGEYAGGIVRSRLSRFDLKPDVVEAIAGSETVLIEQRDRGSWHQGGAMLVHPLDGLLYLTMGDEGFGEQDNVQIITNNLFGGVVRIDVRASSVNSHAIRRQPRDGVTRGYRIPEGNPFLDPDGGSLEEFYAVGLRSPHTLVCDPLTGDLYCGDVGTSEFEEINRIERGGNYGWGAREGYGTAHITPPDDPPGGAFWDPYFAYTPRVGPTGNAGDKAVICGPVYRGQTLRGRLDGKLVFGDNVSGRVWSLSLNTDPAARVAEFLAQVDGSLTTGLARIVADSVGEVYCLQLGERGRIWRLAPSDQPGSALPRTLSETGVFSDLGDLTPTAGFVPYTINQPFWSDGASKRRWVGIPNGGVPYDSGEQALLRHDKAWVFPSGTVFVKHFDLPGTNQAGFGSTRLETRLLVVDQNEETYGFSYKWRPDQTDADLVLAAETTPVAASLDSSRGWYFPSSSDCRTCHNSAAGYLLGLNTRQMNLLIPDAGNQIERWEAEGLGVFLGGRGLPNEWSRLVGVGDGMSNLTERVRTYLDVNCAYCHQPGGRGSTFDARHATPPEFGGLVDAVSKSYGDASFDLLVSPGAPRASELLARIDGSSAAPMPPVGRTQVDVEGGDLIRAWIAALRPGGSADGFAVHYFDGMEFDRPVTTGMDAEIDFGTGAGVPVPVPGGDAFSVRWSGVFAAPVSGDYTIAATAAGGVRILIDGATVLDAWMGGGDRRVSVVRAFQAGRERALVVEFNGDAGEAMCRVVGSLNGGGGNVLTRAHVRSPLSKVKVETRPVIGAQRAVDGRMFLKAFAEGEFVAVEESVDLATWSRISFPGPSNEVRLQPGAAKFFRVVKE